MLSFRCLNAEETPTRTSKGTNKLTSPPDENTNKNTTSSEPSEPRNEGVDARRQRKVTTKLYDPTVGHEPYWPGGDWQVVRPTTTRVPVVAGTTPASVCGSPCKETYRSIGQVCAVIVRTWTEWCKATDARAHFFVRWPDKGPNLAWNAGYTPEAYYVKDPTKDYEAACNMRHPYIWDYSHTDLGLKINYRWDWMNHRTFRSYCEFLQYACKRDPRGPQFGWIFSHAGRCLGYEGVPWQKTYRNMHRWHRASGEVKRRKVAYLATMQAKFYSVLNHTAFMPYGWPTIDTKPDRGPKRELRLLRGGAAGAGPLRGGLPDGGTAMMRTLRTTPFRNVEYWKDVLQSLK